MLPEKLPESLPQSVYTAKQVRENEGKVAEDNGLSLYQLMELAGLSAFNLLRKLWPSAQNVLVLSGKGNNGGDGFVVARLAQEAGLNVCVCSYDANPQYSGDADIALQRYLSQGGQLTLVEDICCSDFDVIVDALLGTGIKGVVRAPFTEFIDKINCCSVPVLSLDIPSGLDADTGKVCGTAVRAEATVTFVAVKQGMLTGQSVNNCGQLYFADLTIGESFEHHVSTDVETIVAGNIVAPCPREKSAHKGNTGFVLAFCANSGYPGAGRLVCEAALRSGAGLVAISCHQENSLIINAGRPEIMLAGDKYVSNHYLNMANKAKVIVVGPGLGLDAWAMQAYQQSLELELPIVVDADALTLLSQSPMNRQDWVLTPHPGEAASLLNCSVKEIEQDRFKAVRQLQKKYGGIVVLKGAGSLICDGRRIAINTSGNPGMASGGMGDVLSGIIAAMLLQNDDKYTAVKQAVYLHGKAADKAALAGEKGLLASDLFPFIRELVN